MIARLIANMMEKPFGKSTIQPQNVAATTPPNAPAMDTRE